MKKLLKISLAFVITVILVTGIIMPEIIMGTPASMAVGNWYQQFLPNIGDKQINDIFFLDSLTGFAVVSRNVNPDTASILKTTNGGENWQIVFTQGSRRFSKVKFINNDTGFVCGGTGAGTPYLYKTTNTGINWTVISSSGCAFWNDMFVLSNDTIWIVDSDGLCGGVFFTSNGGASWTPQLSIGSLNPSYIYMYNARIGFISNAIGSYLRRTTDGGATWTVISGQGGFTDMYFADSLTGWRSFGSMRKTTDGGLNWVTQTLPQGGIILTSGVVNFSNLNKDTIFGVGGEVFYGSGQFRGIIYRTVNGGENWLFQVPDTTIHSAQYRYIQFIDKLKGWAYWVSGGVHTTNGGDPVWLTAIEQISSEVPKEFRLYQNYPNPFNPVTNIKYQITKSKYVNLIVYDITGKKLIDLVNRKQNAGTYEVDFSGNGLSSGVYFYSLIVDSKIIDTKKMILIK